MEILDTIVQREIHEIANSGQPMVAFRWKLLLKAAGKEIKAIYVRNVTLTRLYTTNFADELLITAGFTTGDVQLDIVPYKDQLEATLIREPFTANVQGTRDLSKQTSTNTYKAQLVTGGNSAVISGDSPFAIAKAMGRKADLTEVQFQLYNPVIDIIRKLTFGVVFRNTKPIDAIKYVLMKQAKPEMADASVNIRGVDVFDGYPSEVREQIVIPHLTPVIDVPRVIHENVGGIYPTGFHYYLQSRIWYVYPTFDHHRFGKRERSLTIIKIPSTRMPSLERTYRYTGSQVIVLTTRETAHSDVSEAHQLNTGNGVRFADANRMMDYHEQGGNKAILQARNNVNEIVTDPRRDKSDMVMQGTSRITDKYNIEYSQLALKSGGIIQTVWEHANVELLYPGMPIRYIFMDGSETKELYGTLNAVETIDYQSNINIAEQRFVTNALLTFFVQRESPLRQNDPTAITSSQLVTKD